MKLIEAKVAKEFAQTFLADPILRMAVNSVVDNAPGFELVWCKECLYYSETTGKDSGKPCGYGVCTKPFHITNIVANEDFCSFGQRRADAKMDGDGNGE